MATWSGEGRRPYATDLTDAQWSLIDPTLPPPNLTGRYEKHPRREIINAIFYVLRTGCAWRHLPHDLPPWQTVYWHFRRWSDDGTVDRLHDVLRDRLRDADGRDPMASAAIVDAQSVKGADTVGTPTRGYDAGKRVNGRKRHIVVDTLGLLLVVAVTTVSLQDRDGGARVLEQLRFRMPSVVTVFADGGYAGRLHARSCGWRSSWSRSPSTSRGSPSYRDVGWSSGPSPGSCAADVSTTTTNVFPPPPKPWSSGP